MQVKDIMTSDPACCMPDSSLNEVAKMMLDYDCGEIPVIENEDTKKPVGVVTDRDIVCRTLAVEQDPTGMNAGDIMSQPVVTVKSDTSFEDCKKMLEENQIRRIPVVDDKGGICGIVALADITKYASKDAAGEVLQEVSTDIGSSSNVG